MSNERKPTVLYPNACSHCSKCPDVAGYLQANATTPPIETKRWDSVGTVVKLICASSPEYMGGDGPWHEDRTLHGEVIYTQFVSNWVRKPFSFPDQQRLVLRETNNKIQVSFPPKPDVTCPFSDE